MKYLSLIFSLSAFLVVSSQVQAQHHNHGQDHETKKEEVKTEAGFTDIFIVYGNCIMCKKRIEGSLTDEKGVHSADWDVDTKVMTVKYEDEIISLDEIKKKIVAVGHDTDKYRAKEEAYENLPGCCQYDRPKS